MPPVHGHHRRLVLVLVGERHFHAAAALRPLNHVVVGQDQPFLVQDETRTLPRLRHRPIEPIEPYRGRRNVHHARQHLLVDGNVLLLLLIEGRRRVGHRQVEGAIRAAHRLNAARRVARRVRCTQPRSQRARRRQMGRHVIEPGKKQDHQQNRA